MPMGEWFLNLTAKWREDPACRAPVPLETAYISSNLNLEQRKAKCRALKEIQEGILSWQDKLTLINEAN